MTRRVRNQAGDHTPQDEVSRRITRLSLEADGQVPVDAQVPVEGRTLRSSRRNQAGQDGANGGNLPRQQKENVEVHVHLNQRQQRKGRGRGASRRRAIPEEADGDIFYDDDEEDQGLYVKDGRYGIWAKSGFQAHFKKM